MSHINKDPLTTKTMCNLSLLTPMLRFDSASRVAMLGSHSYQAIPISEPTLPRILSGYEQQLGEYVYDIRIPTENKVVVHSIHNKYIAGNDEESIRENPLTTLVFQDQVTGEYDCVHINKFGTNHNVFGFQYILTDIVDKIRVGSVLEGETILARTNNIHDGDTYSTGIDVEVAYMSDPAALEDGFRVSESFCKRAAPMEVSSTVISFGRKTYPLNIYGTLDNYKIFPGVTDKVREDGLLMACREYDPLYDVIDLIGKRLMEVDHIHDRKTYGTSDAVVYDVLVESGIGESKDKKKIPNGMDKQPLTYINGLSIYYRSILDMYKALVKQFPDCKLGPELQNLVTRAIADTPNAPIKRDIAPGVGLIMRGYKKVPLDEYRVVLHTQKVRELQLGDKVSDLHGCKGVICKISPDEDMPVDEAGNRADMIIYYLSVIGRMNVGQTIDQFINAASRDLTRWIREQWGVLPLDEIWERLLAYYKIVAPPMELALRKHYTTTEDKTLHIECIINDGIYITIDPANTHVSIFMVREIEKIIKPQYGPVTYRDYTGRLVKTKTNVFIGSKQILVLEKCDHRPMAVGASILQHHGMLAGPTASNRLAHSSKIQAVRTLGETEVRLYSAIVGGVSVAELLDISGNPDTTRAVVSNIVTADKPMGMDRVVDRNEHPLGNTRAHMYINQMLSCMGIGLKRGDNE